MHYKRVIQRLTDSNYFYVLLFMILSFAIMHYRFMGYYTHIRWFIWSYLVSGYYLLFFWITYSLIISRIFRFDLLDLLKKDLITYVPIFTFFLGIPAISETSIFVVFILKWYLLSNTKLKIPKILRIWLSKEKMNVKDYIIIVFIFLFLAVVFTYPLLFNINKGIPFTVRGIVIDNAFGDHLQMYYGIWHTKDSILNLRNPLYYEYEMRVSDNRLFKGFYPFPLDLMFLPLSILGNIIGYNLVLWISYSLAGLCSFLLLNLYTNNKMASIIGSLIFAFAPFRVYQTISGHLNGFIFFLIPLFIYFMELALRRKSSRQGILAGLCYLVMSLTEWQMAYYVLIFFIAYCIFRLLQESDYKIRNAGKVIPMIKPLMIIICFILISLIYILSFKTLIIDNSVMSEGRTFDETNHFSGIIDDFYTKRYFHPETSLYLGIIPIIGLLYIFTRLIKNKEKDRLKLFYFFLCLISIPIAIGTKGYIWSLLRKIMPYMIYFRTPSRIMLISFLSISVITALIYKEILESRLKNININHKIILTIMIAMIILIDFSVMPIGINTLNQESLIYNKIKQDDNAKLLELPLFPIGDSRSSVYEYYITIHKKPIINGYNAMGPDKIIAFYDRLSSLNQGLITQKQIQILKDVNVNYIIVHINLDEPNFVEPYFNSSDVINELKKSDKLVFLERDEHMYLFKIK